MCFDHFILLGHSPRGESQTLSLRLFLLFFFSLLLGFFFFLRRARGTWMRRAREDLDAYEMRAHAAPVSWRLKDPLREHMYIGTDASLQPAER